LKDRFGAEVRTHYLVELADEMALLGQEAHLVADVGEHLLEVLARFTRNLRESTSVDQRSGVSARLPIAAAESVAASALRRSARSGEQEATARICDLSRSCRHCAGRSSSRWGRRAGSRPFSAIC
jgi:magnesium chelatase subunit I